MADNFNLRTFLSENKLTKNAQLLKEGSDYGYEAVMDAVEDHFEPGTPEYDQVLRAVEDAFHNNAVDTSDFSHDPSAPGRVVLDIAAGLGLDEAKKEEAMEEVVEEEETIQETLTAKERRLVEMVQDALGIAPQAPVSEEEMVQEKPLPKYESIEKLMQEIDHGTNEAACKYKMNRMKEIAEMLEQKVGSLEEGEGADFVDAKKVKQMKRDIMTLRKQAEKLEKEYEKKFGEKKVKKEEE